MSGKGDFISREAAIDNISSRLNLTDLEGNSLNAKDIRACVTALINHIPAADVRPVVRGKWLVGTYGRVHHICSCCKFDYFSTHTSNFCPSCGADMRGEAE